MPNSTHKFSYLITIDVDRILATHLAYSILGNF